MAPPTLWRTPLPRLRPAALAEPHPRYPSRHRGGCQHRIGSRQLQQLRRFRGRHGQRHRRHHQQRRNRHQPDRRRRRQSHHQQSRASPARATCFSWRSEPAARSPTMRRSLPAPAPAPTFLLADRMALAGGPPVPAEQSSSSPSRPVSRSTSARRPTSPQHARTVGCRVGYDQRSDPEYRHIPNSNITVSNPMTGGGHYSLLSLTATAPSLTAPRPSRPTSPPRSQPVRRERHRRVRRPRYSAAQLNFFNSPGRVNISNTGPLTIGSRQITGRPRRSAPPAR